MSIASKIFRAIHEGKWLSIEYLNVNGGNTFYWICVQDLFPQSRKLQVKGLKLNTHEMASLDIFFNRIQRAEVLEGTFNCPNKNLIEKLNSTPEAYSVFFNNIYNCKILTYLDECHKLSCTPYSKDFSLLKGVDGSMFQGSRYRLTEEQFGNLVEHFKVRKKKTSAEFAPLETLALNLLSVKTQQGLHVLAVRPLFFEVEQRTLVLSKHVEVLNEFILDKETKKSLRISRYLSEENLYLLDNFEANAEVIKNLIHENFPAKTEKLVDDMPYILALERSVDCLSEEYDKIASQVSEGKITAPLKAFFLIFLKYPQNRKNYPIVLFDNGECNLDQLLAIHKGLKYPLAYIQGPPGTGKTKTIENTILSAFFNERTVLFSSNNNHPIDGVFNYLSSLKINGKEIPFPVVRLGNMEHIKSAIEYIKNLFEKTKNWKANEDTLAQYTKQKTEDTAEMVRLLEVYEDRLDLMERKETIEDLLKGVKSFDFQMDLQSKQLIVINEKLKNLEEVSEANVKNLLIQDKEKFWFYLRFLSAKFIQRLKEPRYADLMRILYEEDEDKRVRGFCGYLKDVENFKKFLRVFPIIVTTNISAKKLGDATPNFDMVIMDEASQCDIATSLLPIARGERLMLVGDPQQLNPVITLSQPDNDYLKTKYKVSNEYDFKKNSIYKTFLAMDSVSDEVLLSHHYRSEKAIISFNNKKYYNNKLIVETKSKSNTPLIFIETADEKPERRNTSQNEVDAVIDFARKNSDKSIGIITPFVAQRELIDKELKANKLDGSRIACGTVHSFQGDEKDVILFSLSLTSTTSPNTYKWLSENKELINVAVSRAKEQLVIVSNSQTVNKLHKASDDLYELVNYVKSKGISQVTERATHSRALGLKPYNSKTETDFLENLNQVLSTLDLSSRHTVKTEVEIKQVFESDSANSALFFTGRFDFVLYEKNDGKEYPILGIELDGDEHFTDEQRKRCDKEKERICRDHEFTLIRVPNSYARRYNHIKDVLEGYFKRGK